MIDWSRLVTVEDKAKTRLVAEQQARNAEALAYLSSTDWYMTRLLETGKAVPVDVLDRRELARLAIVGDNS